MRTSYYVLILQFVGLIIHFTSPREHDYIAATIMGCSYFIVLAIERNKKND